MLLDPYLDKVQREKYTCHLYHIKLSCNEQMHQRYDAVKFYNQDRESYIEVASAFHLFPTYGLENFSSIPGQIASCLVL
jgi:hypothetical protein